MLYVLPPPRAPNPPSPWDSILCAGSNAGNGTVADRAPWGDINTTARRPPPRAKIQNLKLRLKTSDDSSCIAAADDDETTRTNKSLSECYFAGKGTALVLPPHERLRPSRRSSSAGSDIQQHLQSMFYLLRQEETLKMAVKLESVHAGRTRYLVVVSCLGRQNAEESCLLGIDCNERTTVGLVLRVLADTTITLDGDGGFSVSVCGRHHIFKPVSVQAMWSSLQTLHKVSSKAREQNYFQGGPTHEWVNYYEQHIESDRSCLNEWHAMDSLESRRPPSPDSIRTKPRERDETEQVIRSTLKEIMMSVDLDEVTSKYIRNRLEEDLDMDLGEFKSFIDQEMLTILGQMDAPTEIFDHVYLGSEWNASNFEELQKNGVGHILNVTREIDNFFPGMFDYLNIRVYDDEKTDLLKYWDNTFKYITKAKKAGSKVLVHCKMGVSRSASVVIAYAMKAYNWDFERALTHVKEKRNCIKPNTSFIAQLETYQGILDAMKNKEKLQRSKSETNLKSPELVNKSEKSYESHSATHADKRDVDAAGLQGTLSGHELRSIGARPKSWSPDIRKDASFVPVERGVAPVFLSLENLSKNSSHDCLAANVNAHTSPEVRRKSTSCPLENARNVLMFNNGQSYSASPNQIVHICKKRSENSIKPLVKHRINELESQWKDKKSLVLNLTTQFENGKSSPPVDVDCVVEEDLVPPMLTAKLVKKEIWDPGEGKQAPQLTSSLNYSCDSPKILNSKDKEKEKDKESVVWSSSTIVRQSVPLIDNNKAETEVFSNNKTIVLPIPPTSTPAPSGNKQVVLVRKDGDLFSNQLDKVFEREERKQQRNSIVVPAQQVTELINEEGARECPSRQSSWSSYDSAVVLGYQGEPREAPSRHSSWGSGDTRTLPSRNSSWGSYDMKPGLHQCPNNGTAAGEKAAHLSAEIFEGSSSGMFSYDRDEIPWYPGTVKRTKQKIEGAKEAEKLEAATFGEIKAHKSPSTETLTSDYSTSVLSENDGPVLVEAYNTGLLHYRSSPELCENQTTSSSSSSIVDQQQQPLLPSNAISKEIDIISDNCSSPHSRLLARGTSRLSVSAPETSSISLITSDCVPLSSCSASNVSHLEVKPDFLRNSKSACETSNSSVINSIQCSFVKKHKNYLENLHREAEAIAVTKRNSVHVAVDAAQNENNDNNCCTSSSSSSGGSSTCISGIVKNLKKEFEAKTGTAPVPSENLSPETDPPPARKQKGSSLPSSPTNNSPYPEENRTSVEDISVKELVGKYEEVGITNATNNRGHVENIPLLAAKSRSRIDFKFFSNKNVRYSCIQMLASDGATDKLQLQPSIVIPTSNLYQQNNATTIDSNNMPKRPPVSSAAPLPSVVMATVVKAANKKQKHNKKDSHQGLNLKPRNNNPVYNTM